jgi:hypothetical protein
MLPNDFRDLEPYLGWALPSDDQRIDKRLNSSIEEATAFYDAMLPWFSATMKYLEGVEPETPREEDRALLLLVVAFLEIADTVEHYAPAGTVGPEELRRFKPRYDSVLGIGLGGYTAA